MNRIPVSSTNVAAVGYDQSTMTLEVEFLNGSEYQYFDVPPAIYQGLIGAESIGSYLAQSIKNNFRYTKL